MTVGTGRDYASLWFDATAREREALTETTLRARGGRGGSRPMPPAAYGSMRAASRTGGEPRLAEAGGEDDEAAAVAALARLGERLERGGLRFVRLGRRVDGIAVLFAGRERGVRAAGGVEGARGVGGDPWLVERAREGPELVEGLGRAGPRAGVGVAVDAEVPLDALAERRARDVAAPDEADAELRGLEAPALRVEGADRAGEARDLDDAALELAVRGAWKKRAGLRARRTG
jgi:hypothetical protein